MRGIEIAYYHCCYYKIPAHWLFAINGDVRSIISQKKRRRIEFRHIEAGNNYYISGPPMQDKRKILYYYCVAYQLISNFYSFFTSFRLG